MKLGMYNHYYQTGDDLMAFNAVTRAVVRFPSCNRDELDERVLSLGDGNLSWLEDNGFFSFRFCR